MQYKKLTKAQKTIRWKRMSYAAKIGKVMALNPSMTLHEARGLLRHKMNEHQNNSRKK